MPKAWMLLEEKEGSIKNSINASWKISTHVQQPSTMLELIYLRSKHLTEFLSSFELVGGYSQCKPANKARSESNT